MAAGKGKSAYGAGKAAAAYGKSATCAGKAAAAYGTSATGAAKAAPPVPHPARASTSEAGRLLRAGIDKVTKPRTVAVKLSINPVGEKYDSEQFVPEKKLKPGVLVPYNRFAPLRDSDDEDGDEEAAAAAAAAGGEELGGEIGQEGGVAGME